MTQPNADLEFVRLEQENQVLRSGIEFASDRIKSFEQELKQEQEENQVLRQELDTVRLDRDRFRSDFQTQADWIAEWKRVCAGLERQITELRSHKQETATVTTTDTCSNCGAKLTNAETARLNWQGEAARLSKELAEKEKIIKYACQDSCEDDTAIRNLCRPFLTEKTCDHDGYGAVPLVTAVENTINALKQQLAQAQAACDEWESKYLELTFKSTDEAKVLREQTERQAKVIGEQRGLYHEMTVTVAKAKDEAKRLEAQCAAMREAFKQIILGCPSSSMTQIIGRSIAIANDALGSTAGQSLLQRLERYEKALQFYANTPYGESERGQLAREALKEAR